MIYLTGFDYMLLLTACYFGGMGAVLLMQTQEKRER
jgi:hypothetical protein